MLKCTGGANELCARYDLKNLKNSSVREHQTKIISLRHYDRLVIASKYFDIEWNSETIQKGKKGRTKSRWKSTNASFLMEESEGTMIMIYQFTVIIHKCLVEVT